MRPLEHLRFVARGGSGARTSALEAAGALAAVADRPAGLLTACRRLVARRPGDGPLLWLAATALAAPDPQAALREAVEWLRSDPTAERTASALPDGAVVAAGPGVSFPAAGGLAERDLQVVGKPAAVAAADVVLCSTCLWGGEAWLAPEGTAAFVDEALLADADVWVQAGRGTVLPTRMWELATEGLDPESGGLEMLPTSGVAAVVGPAGRTSPGRASSRPEGPVVAEIFSGSA